MTAEEYNTLTIGNILKVVTDDATIYPIVYDRIFKRATYPIGTLFVVSKFYDQRGDTVGLQLVHDNEIIPNTSTGDGVIYFYLQDIHKFKLL